MARAQPELDEHDLAILALLAEHRSAHEGHVANLLGERAPRVRRRLAALETRGLIHLEPVFAGQPATVLITRGGLRLIESSLPAPRLDLKGYRHDVGLAWLWLAAGEGTFGRLDAQLSERAMRSHDRSEQATAGARFGIGVGNGPAAGQGRHYPDLLLDTSSGHRVAIELELTSKSRRRLDRIMLAYASDGRIDTVLYLCPPGQIATNVAAAARRAGLSNRVHVQLLAPGSPRGAPEPAPARHPTAARSRSHPAPERSAPCR